MKRWPSELVSEHDLVVSDGRDVLVIDSQPRGGLLIQVGLDRGGSYQEFNAIRLPKKLADAVRTFLRTPERKTK